MGSDFIIGEIQKKTLTFTFVTGWGFASHIIHYFDKGFLVWKSPHWYTARTSTWKHQISSKLRTMKKITIFGSITHWRWRTSIDMAYICLEQGAWHNCLLQSANSHGPWIEIWKTHDPKMASENCRLRSPTSDLDDKHLKTNLINNGLSKKYRLIYMGGGVLGV